MIKKVYFVRHGESELNATKTHQSPDVSLSYDGLDQARKAAERFIRIPIEIIISSDMVRAQQTAEEIAKTTGKEIEFTQLLRERKRPSLLQGKHYESEDAVKVITSLYENRHNKEWRHSDEETFFDAIERARQLLKFIEGKKEKRIAVVSHAAFIKYLLTYVLFGIDAHPDHFQHIYDTFYNQNTGISVFVLKEGWKNNNKVENRWHIVSWNDVAHLGSI